MRRTSLFVLLFAILPSGQAEAREVSNTEPRAPWKAADNTRKPKAVEMFMREVSGSSVSAEGLEAAQRASLTASRLDGGSGLTALTEGDATRPFVYPILSADLDVTPGQELLVVTQPRVTTTPGEIIDPIRVTAKSSAALTDRWSVQTGPGFLGAVDLDGDGPAEVVILDFLGASSWAPLVASGGAFVQRVRAFSGTDGRLLWTRVFEGVFARDDSWFGVPGVSASSGVIASAYFIPATDRAAGNDLFIGRLDYDTASAGASVPDEDRRSAATRSYRFTGEMIRGSDGSSAGSTDSLGQELITCRSYLCSRTGGIPWLMAAWDRPAGTGARIAATSFDLFVGTVDLRTLEGKTLWRHPIPSAYGMAIAIPHEFDGAGDTDVVLASDNNHYDVSMFDGDGWRRWATGPGDGVYGFTVTGDADGDGGADLIVLRPAGLQALSGRTGGPLWTTRLRFDVPSAWDSGSFSYCVCDDFTGDGVSDPLLRARLWVEGSPIETFVAAIDGASGAQMFLSPPLPPDSVVLPLGVDADGDGLRDLVSGAETGSPGSSHRYEARVVSGTTFAEAWRTMTPLTDQTFDSYYYAEALPIGVDLAASGRAELALGILEDGHNVDFEGDLLAIETTVFASGEPIWSSVGP